MNTETFINQQYRNAPHLTYTIAEFMLNAGVVTVLDEICVAAPGWDYDFYAWLVVGANDETFIVETHHGTPIRNSISTTLNRLESHRDNYSKAIRILTSELQQKAHVTT